MSYKNQREGKAKFDYDFIDVAGPSTYQEIDSLFQEYCKDISKKEKTSALTGKLPQHPHASSNTSLLRPSTAKFSNSSAPSLQGRVAWNPSAMARLQERTSPHGHKGIEFEDDSVQKLHNVTNKHNNSNLNVLDEELNQLAQEFGINLVTLATIQAPEKRHEYVIECMRKRVKDDLKDFTKKHNARLNNILNFEVEFQKIKEKQQRDGADIFGWLTVNTPHEPLKKKLRAKLAETIHDYDNMSKIETSLEEIKRTKDCSNQTNLTTKKIMLDNIPHIDNFEIMHGILAGHSDNLLKMTKSMKHASRKNDDSRNTAADESVHIGKKLNETHGLPEKDAEQLAEEKRQWNSNRERIFRFYREDAKGRLFDEIKSSNWNDLGFSPYVQASQKIEKSKQQRDTKLASYMNGDLLTPEDYKLLANTSITLNKFIDKKYMQTVVNNLDPEVIEAIETDLAEKTLKDYQNRQTEAKEARLNYLKDINNEIVDRVNQKHYKAQRHAKVMKGKEEQRKIKQRAVSLLNRVAERKTWKSPKKPVEPIQTKEKDNIDINHFAHKFLKIVNKSVQARKFKRSQEFLKRLLPFRHEPKLMDVKESKHFYHPSSKLIVTSENHAKDYMGLGTENPDPLLEERKNESVADFKLTIHSPPKFRITQNFKKYYSGGPVDASEEEGRVFQGGFIVGNVANYKFDKTKEKVVLQIQAAYRGYRQRKIFKQIQERVQEKNRMTGRMDFLKNHTASNFLKTVLAANDKTKLLKKPKHTTILVDAVKDSRLLNPAVNSNPKRFESINSYNKLNHYDSKLLTLNDTEKARTSHPIDIPKLAAKTSEHHGEGRLNSAKSITSVDLNMNDEIMNLKAKESDGFKSQTGAPRRPQTAALVRNISSASNQNRGRLDLQKQTSEQKQLADNTLYTSDEGSPDEARMNKIVHRAPPKGLLLKQRKLFTAAKNGNFKIILASGFNYYEADVNSKDDQGNTPLYYAAQLGNKDICEFLVNHKARVNEPCKDGNTPLHMAFASGQPMVAILLISHGGNLNILNDANQTAVAFGSETLLALLDLKDAVATYNKQTFSKTLPADLDNNRFLVRFQQRRDFPQDYLSFNYAPLKQSLGRVGSAKRAPKFGSPEREGAEYDE